MIDPKTAWMPDWQSMQKQFFSAWTDAARGGAAPSMPVHEGFDAWLKLFNNRDSGNEMLDKVVGGAKQFADFMQGVIGQLATTRPEFSSAGGIREALEKAFAGFAPNGNPVLDALRSVNSEGARGLEDSFREFMKMVQPIESDARSWMSLPAFGYSRESQERKQAMLKALADYNDQNTRYNTLMFKASRLGLDKFESKLAERSEPGREITSMRGLYDVYIDAAEEGYAEVALSDEFREVYGELVNAQMRVRQAVQSEVEHTSAGLGMPVRSELDTVHQRLHELRRRVAELEEKLAASSDEVAAVVTPIPVEAEPVTAAKPKKKPAAKPKPETAKQRVATKATKSSTRADRS